MRLDISELLSEVGRQEVYPLEEPPLVNEDVECTQPVTGQLTFTNTGGTLLIRGSAKTSVALPCSRCAIYFEHPVNLVFDEQFELQHTNIGPRSQAVAKVVEEDESPAAAKLFEGPIFDLSEMLRQYILLDQPTRPLPAEDSQGRCVQCHLKPEEVLKAFQPEEETAPAEAAKMVNPALAQLGEILKNRKQQAE